MKFENPCRLAFIFCAAAILIFSQELFAQTPLRSYSSQLWQTDRGLPHNTVLSIVQTREGYLWIGTQHGLVRFDGMQFVAPNEMPELAGQSIKALTETSDGALWIAGTNGVFHFLQGKLQHYGVENGFSEQSVLAIHESKDHSIWFGGVNGLTRWQNGNFSKIASGTFRSICEDAATNLYFTAGSAVLKWSHEKLSPVPVEQFIIGVVRSVGTDSNGSLWIGTGNGLLRYQGGGATRFLPEDGLSDGVINAIFEDRDKNLWIGAYGGLNRSIGGKFTKEINDQGYSFDAVFTFFEDREGNLWVGTKEGLYRLNRLLIHVYTTQQGLRHNNVMSVCEGRDKKLWIGTWGGGLHVMKNEKISPWTFAHETIGTRNLILGLCETRDGALWVGTDFDGGLFRLQGDDSVRFTADDGMGGNAIRVLHEDRKGRLWIGTREGLTFFEDGKFSKFSTTNGLASSSIRALAEDQNGNIWIGTEKGLSQWNAREGMFFKAKAAADEIILSLCVDKANSLWIGTTEHGLIHARDGKNFHYTTHEGLADDSIQEIIEDDRDNLWISSPHGIFRMSQTDLKKYESGSGNRITCISYGKQDGLITTECLSSAKPAAWKTHDGRLWFVTAKGLAVIDPSVQPKKNESVPSVIIEEIFTDKRRFEVSSLKFEVDLRSVSGTSNFKLETLNLKPGRGDLEFHYTALSFRAPEKNRFKYKLDGFDEKWIDADTRRIAYYNNVPPGTYHFHLIGCNGDGVWNERGDEITFTIEPHFWQTWWFASAGIVAFAGLVGGSARYVTRRKLRRQMQRLEQQHALERERSRIAQDMHDDLGANLTQITLLSELTRQSATQPERVIAHAEKISDTSRNLVLAMDEIVWAVNPRNDNLNDFAAYLFQRAQEFLDLTPIRFRADRPSSLPDIPLTSEVRHSLFLVVKEALNNTIKHSGATEIWLRLSVKNSSMEISIEDNGKGFSLDATQEFGNGLTNMRTRVENLGGEFCLASEPGPGTKIKLNLNLQKQRS